MGFRANLLLGTGMILASLFLLPLQPMLSAGAPTPIQSMPFATGSILINEVMYDPIGAELDGEWVELHNPGAASVNVTGWTISDQEGGVDFTFPETAFPAGGHALIHVGSGQNSTGFTGGTAEFFMWKTSTLLSNTGDDILLSDSTGATVDFMSYGQWGGASIGPTPSDFDYEHANATAPEGLSLARIGGEFRASAPTPLYPNGDDSVPPLLLVEVHYYAWGENEFFTVHNPLAYSVDVSSWYFSDLEGKAAFPTGTVMAPGQSLTVAQNSSNYQAQMLRLPDFEYVDANRSVPEMANIGSRPSLANAGDELFLLNNFGNHVDAFVYGTSTYSGPGWDSASVKAQPQGRVAKRNFANAYADTNTSADWENIRQYIPGQSEFQTSAFDADGPLTVFASPDSSFQALAGAIDEAELSIWLTVYEFTGNHLADRLLAAIGRGVEVRIFLEGAPVGGITAEELFIARRIVEAGGQVRMMTNEPDDGIHARYIYVHAKYAVLDSETLIIMSENWGQSGVPVPGTTGNRGWGATVHDRGVAGYFSDVFLEDWNPERSDSVAFGPSHKLWGAGSNSTASTEPFLPMFPARAITTSSVLIPVLSPDTSLSQETILGMLGSASERLLVQEFYIYKHWGSRITGSVEATPNLYLKAVIDAARRGCEVRILLDATYYNVDEDDPIDNDDTVDYVNAIAAAEGLDMKAKLVNPGEHGFEKIHNKGLVADGSVLISSINWNLNSVTMNRESGLIIRNAEAADYFAAIFDYDWIDDLTPPFAHFRANASYQVDTVVLLDASTSSDNSGIVNYTWRIDGAVISHDVSFNHTFGTLGTHEIGLTVRDAWGNEGVYARVVNITLDPPDPEGGADGTADAAGDSSMMLMIGVLLLVPIFIFIAILLVAKLRRR